MITHLVEGMPLITWRCQKLLQCIPFQRAHEMRTNGREIKPLFRRLKPLEIDHFTVGRPLKCMDKQGRNCRKYPTSKLDQSYRKTNKVFFKITICRKAHVKPLLLILETDPWISRLSVLHFIICSQNSKEMLSRSKVF